MTPADNPNPSGATNRIADALSALVDGQTELVKNSRSAKRWRIGRIVLFGTLASIPVLTVLNKTAAPAPIEEPYVSMVRLNGAIGPGEGVNAEATVPTLVKAFEDKGAKAVVLVINSPGGTPVQASLIHDRLQRLKKEHPNKPLVVIAEDTMASGAYFIGVAADKIVVNRSSIVGSVGVVSQQFGLTELMQKVGVENRTLTAGISKARMSPFSPTKPEDIEKMNVLLGQIHEHFKDVVREGRKDKLKAGDDKLFNGDIWVGEEAVKLGLADELGDLNTVVTSFGAKKVVEYSPQHNALAKLAKEFGLAVGEGAAKMMISGDVLPNLK